MKRRPSTAYATGEPPAPSRLRISVVGQDAANDVETTGFADQCEAFEELLVGRAVAELEAVEPLPIDKDASRADLALENDLEEHERRRKEHADRVRTATTALDRARARRRDTAPAWSRFRMASMVVAFILLAALLGLVTGIVLMPTIDGHFLTNYFSERGESEFVSMMASYTVAAGNLVGACVAALVFVMSVRGDMGPGRKVLLVVADMVISAAWGAQRLSEGISSMAVAITLLEFGSLLVYTIALIGLAVALRRNASRIDPERDAVAALRLAEEQHRKALQELQDAESDRAALLDRVAARETATRRSKERRALAAETTRVAAAVATAKLANAEIENASRSQYDATLDGALAAQAAELGVLPKGRHKWPGT